MAAQACTAFTPPAMTSEHIWSYAPSSQSLRLLSAPQATETNHELEVI